MLWKNIFVERKLEENEVASKRMKIFSTKKLLENQQATLLLGMKYE